MHTRRVTEALQVVAMRLPVEALLPQLRPILEGVLLWASDSKNKFKLKVTPLPVFHHSIRVTILYISHDTLKLKEGNAAPGLTLSNGQQVVSVVAVSAIPTCCYIISLCFWRSIVNVCVCAGVRCG